MLELYTQVRKHSESICQPLAIEDYVVQPTIDVSPPKWHLAHTTWFWEEFVLVPHLSGYKRFHPRFSFLFNSYYNSVGDRVLRLDRGNMSRPTVTEIIAYRAHVDFYMSDLLLSLPDELHSLIELGIQHEQQHQELLLTDIKYIFGHNPLFPIYQENFNESTTIETDNSFVSLPAGQYTIGYQGNGFCFDNEQATHQVFLSEFSIRKSLVTNDEYLSFMADGGYNNAIYWHSDGWAWVNQHQLNSPLYWHFIDGEWYRYALAGLHKVNNNEALTHISFYEAAAFAEWKSMRLPTEFEWEVASDLLAWGQRWEHTNSAYLAYPGYTRPPGAIGEYNGKFMINQMVLRGASIATPHGHSRKTYRNFFHPNLRWQFNGLRLCKK